MKCKMSYQELKCKEVTVRKAKRCEWCPEMISIGEKAQVRVYVYDGDFHDEKMHPECYAAMLNMFRTRRYGDDTEFEECSFKRGTSEQRW